MKRPLDKERIRATIRTIVLTGQPITSETYEPRIYKLEGVVAHVNLHPGPFRVEAQLSARDRCLGKAIFWRWSDVWRLYRHNVDKFYRDLDAKVEAERQALVDEVTNKLLESVVGEYET